MDRNAKTLMYIIVIYYASEYVYAKQELLILLNPIDQQRILIHYDWLFSLAYSISVVTKSLQYASVNLTKNAAGVSSNFIQDQENSADPGGPLIVLKNGTPIIYGWFFL